MPFTNKLSRAMINRTPGPWGLIPETQMHASIVTNGHLAVECTPFEAKRFTLAYGQELAERPETSHKLLPRSLSKAKELRRTCILSDEANRVSRMYIDTDSTPYFFDVQLLKMISDPEVLWTSNGGMATNDIDRPTLWLMRVRTPVAEDILR